MRGFICGSGFKFDRYTRMRNLKIRMYNLKNKTRLHNFKTVFLSREAHILLCSAEFELDARVMPCAELSNYLKIRCICSENSTKISRAIPFFIALSLKPPPSSLFRQLFLLLFLVGMLYHSMMLWIPHPWNFGQRRDSWRAEPVAGDSDSSESRQGVSPRPIFC